MDLLKMITETYLQKATQTSLLGANFSRQDLSPTIYLEGMPPAHFFLRLPVVPAKARQHYWSKTSIPAPDGTAGYAEEGAKPASIENNPDRLSNNLFRRGFTCKITATEMALFAAAGGWNLSEFGILQKFNDELSYQMFIGTKRILSWLNFCYINGDSTVHAPVTGSTDYQCDGLIKALKYLDSNLVAQGNIVDASAQPLSEAMLITLGKQIKDRKTELTPQILYVTTAQKKIINTWGGTLFFTRNTELPGGRDVSTYNTGFFIVNIDVEYDLPTGTGVSAACMVDHTDMKRAELIPMGAEPLAKVDNSIERMLTWEGTFEYGTPVSSGLIENLAA